MKKTIFTLILSLQIIFVYCQTWTQKADYGGCQRYFGFSFVLNDKAYVGGGATEGCGLGFENEVWEYDPTTDQWTQKADIPIDPYDLKAFSADNYGYIVVYFNNSGTWETQVWQYDPITDQWTQKNNFPGDNRIDGIAFSIGNKGYYGLGNPSTPYKTDIWEYDPTIDQWTQKADMPVGRRGATAFSIGTKGYVGLGSNLKDFWEFNPLTNTWTSKTDFGGTARQFAVGFNIGEKGYVGTGYGLGYKNDFWEYNSLNDTWTEIENLPGPVRQGAVAFMINDKGYVTTGYDGSGWVTAYKDLWEYSISSSVQENTFNDCVINIFPNPTNGKISIDAKNMKSVEILNIEGKQEYFGNETEIDFSLYKKGIYIIKIITDKQTITRKLIKQ